MTESGFQKQGVNRCFFYVSIRTWELGRTDKGSIEIRSKSENNRNAVKTHDIGTQLTTSSLKNNLNEETLS